MLEDYVINTIPNGRKFIDSIVKLNHQEKCKKLMGIIFSPEYETAQTEGDFSWFRQNYQEREAINWCEKHNIACDYVSRYPRYPEDIEPFLPVDTKDSVLRNIRYIGTDLQKYAQLFRGILRPADDFDYESILPLLIQAQNAKQYYSTDFSLFK